MRHRYLILSGLALTAGITLAACGDSSGDGGSGGSGGSGDTTTGTTTSTKASTTVTATVTTSASTTTGGGCDTSDIPDPACAGCIEGSCCTEWGACFADADCADCLTNPNADPAVCDQNAALTAVNDCATTNCSAECGITPPITPACDAPTTSPSMGSCFGPIGPNAPCNPVTNEGCDAKAGQACDYGANGYECYDPPNDALLCEECGQATSFCAGGMTCVGTCAKFCCDNGDCGTGTCDLEAGDGVVGLCVEM